MLRQACRNLAARLQGLLNGLCIALENLCPYARRAFANIRGYLRDLARRVLYGLACVLSVCEFNIVRLVN